MRHRSTVGSFHRMIAPRGGSATAAARRPPGGSPGQPVEGASKQASKQAKGTSALVRGVGATGRSSIGVPACRPYSPSGSGVGAWRWRWVGKKGSASTGATSLEVGRWKGLLDNLSHHAGTDGAAALADSKAQAGLHGHCRTGRGGAGQRCDGDERETVDDGCKGGSTRCKCTPTGLQATGRSLPSAQASILHAVCKHKAPVSYPPGLSSSKVAVTLSPGITISVPSGRVTEPAG